MQKLLFPFLLLLLFIVSYNFWGVIFSIDSTTNQSSIKSGIHTKVKKAPISFDRSARVEEE